MKFIALTAIAFSALFTSAPAQVLTDTFSGAGGAWTTANQPDFTSSTGGTLYSDQAIAAGTNNSTSNTDAILTVGAGQYEGIYGPTGDPPGYLYTGNGTPALTLSTSNILDGVNTVSLSIDAAYGTFTSTSTTLSLDGSLSSFNAIDTGTKAGGYEVYDYTWNWNVSDASSTSSLDISWQTPVAHTAYTEVELTQAVPEPSTWALMMVAGVVFLFYRSRQRNVMQI